MPKRGKNIVRWYERTTMAPTRSMREADVKFGTLQEPDGEKRPIDPAEVKRRLLERGKDGK